MTRITVVPPEAPTKYTIWIERDGRASDGGRLPTVKVELTRLELVKLRVAIGRALESKRDP